MLLLRFTKMSMPQAEEQLALLWCAAEEYGLESPLVNFCFLPGSSVTFEVVLNQQDSTAVVRWLCRHANAPQFTLETHDQALPAAGA